jgi:hypothetical protein
MLPPSFSFHEAYGKHRSPDEMREMDQKNQQLEIRAYQYGDPVNTNEQFPTTEPMLQEEKVRVSKPRRLAWLVLRFVNFFFS